MIRFVHAIAPYCGLFVGLAALGWPPVGAVVGREKYPSPVSVESLTHGEDSTQWLELQEGTLLLTELVIDAEVASVTGEESVKAYLVPYVVGETSGASADGTASRRPGPERLVVVSFTPDDFEARFPRAYAWLEGGSGLDSIDGESPGEFLGSVFDRRSCEVLRSDASNLSPHVRHFLQDHWGVAEGSILLCLAGQRPMKQSEAMLWVGAGFALAAAGAFALGRRLLARRAASHAGW